MKKTLVCALLALLTSACTSLTGEPASGAAADALAVRPGGKTAHVKPKKVAPVRVHASTLDAFRGQGLVYVDDNRASRMALGRYDAKKGLWTVKEFYSPGTPHGFTWGTGAAHLLRDGRRVRADAPDYLKVEKNGSVTLIWKAHDYRLNVELVAWNVSELPVAGYLKNRFGARSTASYFVHPEAVFPKGSLVYEAKLTALQDTVIVPSTRTFTGSSTMEDFMERFKKSVPYCLRYLPPAKARTPMGFRFEKDARAAVGAKGEAMLYKVKRGTVFCDVLEERDFDEADWRIDNIEGTKVLSFDFSRRMNPENYGMPSGMQKALKVAFAEERSPTNANAAHKVVPAALWVKGSSIVSPQYRFNATAARAVEGLLEACAARRQAWEKSRK